MLLLLKLLDMNGSYTLLDELLLEIETLLH